MKIRIRSLTTNGIKQFQDWLSTGAGGFIPVHLLTDTETSEPLPGAGEAELGSFTNRYELAMYCNNALVEVPLSSIPRTHGVWSWLSLFFFDVIAPRKADGTRDLKETVRYIGSQDYQKYYRHLIGFGVYAIRVFETDAEPLLVSTKPGILHTDYCEQIFGYQDLCQTKAFVSTANALYFDKNERKIRRGATPNKKKSGTLRRLGDVFYQLEVTFDVQGMGRNELSKLLPDEFAGWQLVA